MRHSYLPNIEQKQIKKIYRIRVAVVMLLFISAVAIIGSISLLPSYLEVYKESQSQLGNIKSIKDNPKNNRVSEIENELNSDKNLISILSSVDERKFSEMIQDIVSIRGNLTISSIIVDRIPGTSAMSVGLQGKSPDRESLVSFKKRLEGLKSGNKVDLPISDLTQSKNIQFTLKLTEIKK
jgi:hypothetical protein